MKLPARFKPPIRLRDFDPGITAGLDKDKTRKRTKKLCQQIGELQALLNANASHALLLLFQGMDTSGKDGSIRSVLEFVNPAGVFNRSHYEDVLIVRVLKLQPERVWRARYEQINAFEKHLAENRVIQLKFFLHISKEEQAERLQSRLDNPRKNWKFEAGDLQMRAKWNEFQRAYEDVLNRCSTRWAPWYIVPADRKWVRDYVIARTVVGALKKLKLKWPKPTEDLSRFKVI